MRLADAIRRAKASMPPDPVIGAAFGGGYYFGKMRYDDGYLYWLILAPKANEVTRQLKTTASTTSGTASAYDGLANTLAMIAAGAAAHPAASYCVGYTDGDGNNDYYLWAGFEAELAYRNLKPTTNSTTTQNSFNPNPYSDPAGPTFTASVPSQTSLTLFRSTGAQALLTDGTSRFWTSSQSTTTVSNTFNWRMEDAVSAAASKTASSYVRPIRRVKIPNQ